MSRKDVRGSFVLLLVLLQGLAIFTLTVPPSPPIALLNNTETLTASVPNTGLVYHNVSSPRQFPNMFDYPIAGTPLVLRIIEIGRMFMQTTINNVMDSAIRFIVKRINAGDGRNFIDDGVFMVVANKVDLRITSNEDLTPDESITYFLLGDILSGVWQYMNEPWSSFREIVFDILLIKDGAAYDIGSGSLTKPTPVPPSSKTTATSSRETNFALKEIA